MDALESSRNISEQDVVKALGEKGYRDNTATQFANRYKAKSNSSYAGWEKTIWKYVGNDPKYRRSKYKATGAYTPEYIINAFRASKDWKVSSIHADPSAWNSIYGEIDRPPTWSFLFANPNSGLS